MKTMVKTILYVDDDPDDRELLQDVVNQLNPEVNVEFAENGLQALDYLNKKKESVSQPCLIVLDINMPLLDGKETYKKIKDDQELNTVPIIVFTSSRNPNDKAMFNNLGVEFISKPHDYAHMHKIVSHMINFCG